MFYGWYIVGTIAFINAVIGGITTLGFTAMVDPIAATMNFSYAQISLATTLRGVEAGVMNPFVGALSDRWPARRLVFIGIALLGIGLICLSQIKNLPMFYLSFVIMGIGGSLGTQMVPMAVVARWFRRNAGKAYGLMAAGIGAGGFLVPVVTSMIDAHGWQTVLLWLGFGILAMGLPLSFVLRDRPEDYGLLPDGAQKRVSNDSLVPVVQEVSMGVKDALRTRAFWFIAIAFMLQVAGGSALMLHIMPYLTSLDIDRATASMITMFLSVVGIPSRFAMGWLCDIIRRNYVAAISVASSSIGLFLFSIIRKDSLWAIIGFIAFYSLGRGGQISIMPSLIREHFGPAKFGSIFGLMSVFITIAVVTTPPLAGWVRDTQGDYGPIWLIFSVVGIVGVILALAIPRSSRKLEPVPG